MTANGTGPAAQTVDGKLKVQATGFPTSAFILLVQPWGLSTNAMEH
jgi:hypothetical protein